jgi:hypothetical protein
LQEQDTASNTIPKSTDGASGEALQQGQIEHAQQLSITPTTAIGAKLSVLPGPRNGECWTHCGPCSVRGATGDHKSATRKSSNLRVGSQLPFHIVTAGPEDDASGAAGLELGETIAQLLASACEGHLFGGGYVDERVMAV